MNESDLEQYLSQKMRIYDFPVGMLVPYEDNPRDNDDAVAPTAESIRKFGFKVPMVIDRDMIVVCGHTRLKAAKQIGRHRLMCGDSTSKDDVQKLMGGELADLLLTDPPYGVSYEGSNGMTIDNDSLQDAEFIEFLKKAFSAADSVMKQGAAFYIWHADSKGYEFRFACKETGWSVRECLIWVKNTLVLGRQDYQWRHEPCLYGWLDGAGHTWASDRKQTTVLEYDRPAKNDIHPTMKPVPLFEYQVRNSSLEGQKVLDLFCGSGTTGVACQRSNRTAYLMEYDPKYAEAAISRLEDVTGETAKKISD